MKDYTICAYMRLSSEDSDIFGRKVESGSITAQRQLIHDYIKKQPEFEGCNVIERFDDGISGRDFGNSSPSAACTCCMRCTTKVNCASCGCTGMRSRTRSVTDQPKAELLQILRQGRNSMK